MGSADATHVDGTLWRATAEETLVSSESGPWCFESALLPHGDVTVSGSRCSACGRCVLSCSTGALAQGSDVDAPFLITFDSSACSACEACVSSCPEGAIEVRHVIESSQLTSHRRTVVDIASNPTCSSCGSILAGGLASSTIVERLATSHPRLAERLRTEVRCTDCLLTL
ncbi:MAG TPA: 4Fe-4S dicluster domain-containing protein [Acidimicrobiales bacterium]|nr:4Fe-4S dicluster domain-containing protein [Acidimicrobiales bacterium]